MCSTHGHRAYRRAHRRFGNRDEWLAKLEEHQRDLEQELADVADLIRRLKEGTPETTPTA